MAVEALAVVERRCVRALATKEVNTSRVLFITMRREDSPLSIIMRKEKKDNKSNEVKN